MILTWTALRERARQQVRRFVIISHVQCEVCLTEWMEGHRHSPLFFLCPECGRRRGIRIDGGADEE